MATHKLEHDSTARFLLSDPVTGAAKTSSTMQIGRLLNMLHARTQKAPEVWYSESKEAPEV
jgi:hypothetical protein